MSIHGLIGKYSTFFLSLFCENLVDLNEARLHEATLNLHMHERIISCPSIASVDGKQHLSQVVYNVVLRIFIVHY